jgi:hypothetical protein
MQRRYCCLDTRVARNSPRVQIRTNGSIGQDIMQTALNHRLMQVMSAIHDRLCEVVPLHVMPLASQDLLDCQHQLSCRTVYGRTVAGIAMVAWRLTLKLKGWLEPRWNINASRFSHAYRRHHQSRHNGQRPHVVKRATPSQNRSPYLSAASAQTRPPIRQLATRMCPFKVRSVRAMANPTKQPKKKPPPRRIPFSKLSGGSMGNLLSNSEVVRAS